MTDEREEIARIIDRLESSDPDFNDCTDAANILRAILARDEGRRGVVGGDWVLVPRDLAATFAEVAGWYDAKEADTFEVWQDYPHGLISRKHAQLGNYRRMASALAAAPSPPVADKVGEQDKGSSQGSGQRGCGSRDEPAVGATAALAPCKACSGTGAVQNGSPEAWTWEPCGHCMGTGSAPSIPPMGEA